MLNLNDDLVHDHFRLALGMAEANSRCAHRIGQLNHLPAVLQRGPVWLTVGRLARWFECSKPTVRSFIHAGFLRCRRRSLSSAKNLVSRESALLFVALCTRKRAAWRPRGVWAFVRINERLRRLGPATSFNRLPPVLTIAETAEVLRCGRSSVRRMIEIGNLSAFHPTPHRWAIRKRNLPMLARYHEPKEIP